MDNAADDPASQRRSHPYRLRHGQPLSPAGAQGRKWYGVDPPEVISERRRYYSETADYKMLAGDARERGWLESIPETECVVVMEGLSMYLLPQELSGLAAGLCTRFGQIALLTDCYTSFAARMSKYKNPINDVGVTEVFGSDGPAALQSSGLVLVQEHSMTPEKYIGELSGAEKLIFKALYAGSLSKRLYRLYEYRKE